MKRRNEFSVTVECPYCAKSREVAFSDDAIVCRCESCSKTFLVEFETKKEGNSVTIQANVGAVDFFEKLPINEQMTRIFQLVRNLPAGYTGFYRWSGHVNELDVTVHLGDYQGEKVIRCDIYVDRETSYDQLSRLERKLRQLPEIEQSSQDGDLVDGDAA